MFSTLGAPALPCAPDAQPRGQGPHRHLWPEFKTRVAACYQAPSRAIARQLATGIRADYADVLPSAFACFEDDFGACNAHLRLPVTHRRFIRTTNLLERLFVEERRRLKIIPNGFGEKPVLKLMFGALIRAAERWRGLRFTEFELRQIAAVRKELDQEYEDFDNAAGKVIPAPRFQQIRALTLSQDRWRTRLGKYRRGVYSVLWRAAWSGFLGLGLVGAVVGYVSFDSFSVPSPDRIRQVSAGVVFTGQFDRVDVGLRLADAGAVPRLYISGVNGNAGIDPARFVEQFSLRKPDIADLRRLISCCVEWGERADNTFQNAQDTKCWVDRRGLTGPLLLITSRQHMARARAALSGALPDRVIVPYPVEDGPPRSAGRGCASI